MDTGQPARERVDPGACRRRREPGVEPGTCVATEGVPGFRVRVTRELYELGRGGALVDSEESRPRYDPEHEVVGGTSGPG